STAATVQNSRRTCRGSRPSWTSMTRPVPDARASCTGSVRTEASGCGARAIRELTRRPKYACHSHVQWLPRHHESGVDPRFSAYEPRKLKLEPDALANSV